MQHQFKAYFLTAVIGAAACHVLPCWVQDVVSAGYNRDCGHVDKTI